MRKWVAVIVGMVALTNSVVSLAEASVGQQMKTIASHYGAALKADTAEVFERELAAMRAAALKAQQEIPAKLKKEGPDSAKIQDYHHGMQILIEDIDRASALAASGKMPEAKKSAEEFKTVRNEYHKKYR